MGEKENSSPLTSSFPSPPPPPSNECMAQIDDGEEREEAERRKRKRERERKEEGIKSGFARSHISAKRHGKEKR